MAEGVIQNYLAYSINTLILVNGQFVLSISNLLHIFQGRGIDTTKSIASVHISR